VSWKRHLAYLALSLVGGFVIGFITAMLCTPLLWKLEPILNIELAGHSGPSDWVMWLFFGFFAVLIEAVLVLFYRRGRRRAVKGSNSSAL
jgi:hypothetical protein